MSWKNGLIRVLLWILNPKATRPPHEKKPSRFLIVSTTGLGDTLWGTPAIRALRQSYPESYIAALTSEMGFELLEHNKNIDELFVLPSTSLFSLLRFARVLKRHNFDTILIFHTSQRLVIPYCAYLEPAHLIGSEGINKDLDYLLTKVIKKTYQHEIERRLEIVKEAGAYVSDYFLDMPISKEDEQAVNRFLARHQIPDHLPLIALHPGAKNKFKQWRPESFIDVGRRLVQNLGCQILITGDESEASLILQIQSQIPGAIPVVGELKVAAFTGLIKKLSLFITNDTGPMHLAFAMQTPTIALFGPTDPHLCGPYHVSNAQVIATKKVCKPCAKKNCPEPFCMMQIGPEAVYEAALNLFYASLPAGIET